MNEGERDVIRRAAMLLDEIRERDERHEYLHPSESEEVPLMISELRRITVEDEQRKERSLENQAALGDG